jgi:hypothetical protein
MGSFRKTNRILKEQRGEKNKYDSLCRCQQYSCIEKPPERFLFDSVFLLPKSEVAQMRETSGQIHS